jgi:hypothetical protein
MIYFHCFPRTAQPPFSRGYGKAMVGLLPDFLSMLVALSNSMRLSLQSSTGVADRGV